MVEVTKADRDWLRAWQRDYGRKGTSQQLLEAVARHRLAGVNVALERAAKVADRRDTGDMQREDMEARAIASAIRALKGPSNG